MESAEETAMGIAEARDRKRPCKADSILWRTLVLVRHQNVCQPSNLQRRAGKSRTYYGGERGVRCNRNEGPAGVVQCIKKVESNIFVRYLETLGG